MQHWLRGDGHPCHPILPWIRRERQNALEAGSGILVRNVRDLILNLFNGGRCPVLSLSNPLIFQPTVCG